METKNSIRKDMLAMRGAISVKERMLYSRKIKEKLLSLDIVHRAKNILCYAGYGSEVSTDELIEELFCLGKNVFLPRVNGEEMDFYRIESLDDLEEGYKGILEPKKSCTDVFGKEDYEDDNNSVMLMPGAVFAPDGSRIGYGKGYYDRYLDKYDIMNRIALCFSIQIREYVPSDAHDKKASIIVSEKEIMRCGKVNN